MKKIHNRRSSIISLVLMFYTISTAISCGYDSKPEKITDGKTKVSQPANKPNVANNILNCEPCRDVLRDELEEINDAHLLEETLTGLVPEGTAEEVNDSKLSYRELQEELLKTVKSRCKKEKKDCSLPIQRVRFGEIIDKKGEHPFLVGWRQRGNVLIWENMTIDLAGCQAVKTQLDSHLNPFMEVLTAVYPATGCLVLVQKNRPGYNNRM